MLLERAQRLRERIAGGTAAWGVALSADSSLVAEQLGSVGFDWMLVDQEHSSIDVRTRTQILQALSIGAIVPIVRVPQPDPVLIGQALDAGAAGVIVPGAEDPVTVAAVARAFRYPPEGTRGLGPYRSLLYGGDFIGSANKSVLCILMVESPRAVENLAENLSVLGVDGIFFGPGDMTLSSGSQPHEKRHSEFRNRALELCTSHGKVPGIFAGSGAAGRALAADGWQLVALGLDAQLLLRAAREELAAARNAD